MPFIPSAGRIGRKLSCAVRRAAFGGSELYGKGGNVLSRWKKALFRKGTVRGGGDQPLRTKSSLKPNSGNEKICRNRRKWPGQPRGRKGIRAFPPLKNLCIFNSRKEKKGLAVTTTRVDAAEGDLNLCHQKEGTMCELFRTAVSGEKRVSHS